MKQTGLVSKLAGICLLLPLGLCCSGTGPAFNTIEGCDPIELVVFASGGCTGPNVSAVHVEADGSGCRIDWHHTRSGSETTCLDSHMAKALEESILELRGTIGDRSMFKIESVPRHTGGQEVLLKLRCGSDEPRYVFVRWVSDFPDSGFGELPPDQRAIGKAVTEVFRVLSAVRSQLYAWAETPETARCRRDMSEAVIPLACETLLFLTRHDVLDAFFPYDVVEGCLVCFAYFDVMPGFMYSLLSILFPSGNLEEIRGRRRAVRPDD